MVKFSFLVLASALAATANAAAPVVKKTIKLGSRTLRRGDPGTEALLKKARPYNKKTADKKVSRRAEEDQFEIDGTYSLQFSECIDVKTYDEDLFNEDIVAYVQAGQIVSTKSYVLFHVCQGNNCYYESDDDLYIVDLATYLTNVATYHANKRTDYCEQCDEFEDYCNPEEEAAEEEVEEEAEEEGEEEAEEEDVEEEEEEGEEDAEEGEDEDEDGRKLKKAARKLTKRKNKKAARKAAAAITRKLANKEYIDCDQCSYYGCYVDEEDLDDGAVRQGELDEEVSEWIANLAECQATGTQWNGLDLYTGVMCSSYGDGVELAVFANEDCTWYTNQESFQNVYNPYDNADENGNSINYLTYAENFIKAAFSEVTPCLQTEYANPDEAEEEDANEDEEEQQYEANDYCKGVMEENAVSWNNCAAEEQDEEEDNDDQYNWYTYDLKEADDVNKVCAALNAMDSSEYSHVYDEDSSGTWYTRNKKGTIVSFNNEKEGLGGGAIAAIVCVVIGVLGAAGFFLTKAKKGKAFETDYQGGEMS